MQIILKSFHEFNSSNAISEILQICAEGATTIIETEPDPGTIETIIMPKYIMERIEIKCMSHGMENEKLLKGKTVLDTLNICTLPDVIRL